MLPVYLDCPFLISPSVFTDVYFVYILVTYTVNQEHNVNFNFACLWVENKPSMSIVYRESRTSSEWLNGMTYKFMYTHIINSSTDGDFIRIKAEQRKDNSSLN